MRGCGVLVCTGTQVAAVEAEGVHADADAIGGGCRERYGFEAEVWVVVGGFGVEDDCFHCFHCVGWGWFRLWWLFGGRWA